MPESNTPASMGGPLSEAEGAAARIRAYLDACSDANSFGREIRWELRDADGHPYNLPRADLVAVLEALGVLEGQLATARADGWSEGSATALAAGCDSEDQFRANLGVLLFAEEQRCLAAITKDPTSPRLNGRLSGLQHARDIVTGKAFLGLDGGDPGE